MARSSETSAGESGYFFYIICFPPLSRKQEDVALILTEKWNRSQNGFILHICPKSYKVYLIPLEKEDIERYSLYSLCSKEVNSIPHSYETLLVTKTGTLHSINNTQKARNIVHEIRKGRHQRRINIEDIEKASSKRTKQTDTILQSSGAKNSERNELMGQNVDDNKSFFQVYFSLQRKHRKQTKCKPPNDEVISVAGQFLYKNQIGSVKRRNNNKNVKQRMSWHEGQNKMKVKVSRINADDSESRENYFLEDKTVSVSPSKISQQGKYAPALIKHLRDITNLPLDERPFGITVQVFPSRRGKFNKPAYRRSRTHNAQAQEGIANQTPTQVSDAASANLDLPPPEQVQTSSTSIFRSSTSNRPAPTTSLMVSVDAERTLVNRLGGQLPESRFSRPQRAPKHPQYSDQPARERSFSNWPSSTGQDSTRMAIYGFFYTGRFDLIRCFQCGIGLKDWAVPDEPLFEHIKHSPDCAFLKELLGQELLNAYRDNLLASQLSQTTGSSQRTTENPAQAADRVRNPQYSEPQARLRSYDNWPATSRQRPQALADAGLFYTGFNDLCRCFTCDGGLQRWDAEDDPWIEHARWFPHCAYVRQIKGQEYINMVQQAAAQAREEEEDPAVVYPPPGQQGRRGPVEQGPSDAALQDTNPLNTLAAQRVIGMGYSRRAVLLAIHEYNGQAHGERDDYTVADLVRILTERQDRGEALPPDSPRDSYAGASASVLLPENLDPEEENRRLKGILKCMQCEENDTNILFLPCTHHRLCEDCAESAIICPVCGRRIDEKIKTFMS